ncbi:MAG: ABC transporter permease subunit [Clostridia bacterium]|nr:ABC transporter permease subunit [Clostridia bacterium]
MKKINNALNLILPLFSILVVFALWGVASSSINNEYILPSVKKTFEALLSLATRKDFYIALFSTLLRSLIAFVSSFLMGFGLAFLRSRKEITSRLIDPIISVIRALPTIAVVLLLLFWTNSRVAPIIVTLLVVLPTSYTNLYAGFSAVNKNAVEAGKVDGANGWQLFAFIEFPQITPVFYKAIGSGFSLNFKLMVAAEVIAQTANCLGYMLNTSKIYFEVAEMMALVLVSVAVGVLIEFIFNKISDKVGAWR